MLITRISTRKNKKALKHAFTLDHRNTCFDDEKDGNYLYANTDPH